MTKVEELEEIIKMIEDKNNYYALFGHIIKYCAVAKDRKTQLWNEGYIGDTDSLVYTVRIDRAYFDAIETHKKWVIKRLSQTASEHTIETLVSTIYNDIFD